MFVVSANDGTVVQYISLGKKPTLIKLLISNELEEKLSMCRLFQSTNDDQRNR